MRLRDASIAAILAITAGVLLSGCANQSAEKPEIVFFYVDDCNKCDRMKDALAELLDDNLGLSTAYYEIETNQALFLKLSRRHNLGTSRWSAPTIFVGDTAIVGDGRAQEMALQEAVEACASEGCRSPL